MDTVDRDYPWAILILDEDPERSEAVRQKILQAWPNSRIEVKRDNVVDVDWAGIEAVLSFSKFSSVVEWIRNATLIPVLVYSDASSLDLANVLVKKSCFHQFHKAFSTLLNCSFTISFT